MNKLPKYFVVGVFVSFLILLVIIFISICFTFPKFFIFLALVFSTIFGVGYLVVERDSIKERFLCLKKSWKEED